MNTKLFFENFDLIAQAPNGVQKLRELILQLAVQGKLVQQDTTDSPAFSLLKKKTAEQKSRNNENPINKVDYPFDIPTSWCWVRIPEICSNFGQKVPDTDFTYIDVSSINNEKGKISNELKIISPKEAPSRARKIVTKNSVLYSTVRPYLLNIAIVEKDYDPEPIASTAFAICHPIEGILNKYLYYCLRSGYFTSFVENEMKGMAYPAISESKFYDGLVPLPPSNEQKRIVGKIEECVTLCHQLEEQQQQKRKTSIFLNSSSIDHLLSSKTPQDFKLNWIRIRDNFDLLYENVDNVQKLKQAILQLAVMGKLVQQDPNDEPASVLLEKIDAEKERLMKVGIISKDKKESPIDKGTPPWDLPNNWRWVRIRNIYEVTRGGSPRPSGDPRYFGGDIPWITVNELTKDENMHLLKTKSGLTEEGSKRSRFVYPIDLLLTNSGATLGVPKISEIKGCINDGVARLYKFHDFIINEFSYYYLTQQTSAFRKVNQGMGQPNLNTPIISGWFFPLPPLNEQELIVKKIREYYFKINSLKSRLHSLVGIKNNIVISLLRELVDVEFN